MHYLPVVAQRFAMKLMRHSDIRLTAQVYTDEMQLPIYDAIKNLPRLDAGPGYTQIRAQILGGDGQTVRLRASLNRKPSVTPPESR
jgi:hypothetical protein